jgi:hypothetical protein
LIAAGHEAQRGCLPACLNLSPTSIAAEFNWPPKPCPSHQWCACNMVSYLQWPPGFPTTRLTEARAMKSRATKRSSLSASSSSPGDCCCSTPSCTTCTSTGKPWARQRGAGSPAAPLWKQQQQQRRRGRLLRGTAAGGALSSNKYRGKQSRLSPLPGCAYAHKPQNQGLAPLGGSRQPMSGGGTL